MRCSRIKRKAGDEQGEEKKKTVFIASNNIKSVHEIFEYRRN